MEIFYGWRYSVNQFWPECWLEVSTEKRVIMDRSFLVFGPGTRTCIGNDTSQHAGDLQGGASLLLMRFEVSVSACATL